MSPVVLPGLLCMTNTLDVFATGLQMGESPRWHDGRFWMCDWLAGQVLVFAADGSREVVATVEGMPFSIDWLRDGRLLVSTPDGVRVGTDLAPYGAEGRPWNEIVVDPAGAGLTSTCPARCRGRTRPQGRLR